ncbi:MAG: LuxR C-terminal-related transcriptional regulator [Planctomycetota bacterium]
MDGRNRTASMGGSGGKSKSKSKSKSKGEKKRERKKRRCAVAGMHAAGRRMIEIARALRCSEQTVRQHVRAIREAARRRVVAEWGPGAADTGEFVEAMEETLQKVRAAQGESDPAKANHRGLLQLELTTLREMMDLRREIAAARLAEGVDEWAGLEHLTNDELLQKARELGIDVSGFERALRLIPGASAPSSELRVPSSELRVPSSELRVPGSGEAEVGTNEGERPAPLLTPDPSPLPPDPSPLTTVSAWCPIMPEPGEAVPGCELRVPGSGEAEVGTNEGERPAPLLTPDPSPRPPDH